ncbi:MAG: hypothetical protein ACR2GD_03280, partial [Pyrinomonadaceae bacterium]
MKICPNCHQTAADNIRFCGKDGTPLIDAPVAAPSAPVAPPSNYQPSIQPPPAPHQHQQAQHQQVQQHQPHDANALIERITCKWCHAMNEKTAVSCRACGAPLDIKDLVSESGWREAPRIKDMTEIRFGGSTCQVEGEIVPVAEINLAPNDSIFFEHHVLLWKDDATRMSVMTLQGGIKR